MSSPPYKSPHGASRDEDDAAPGRNGYLDDMLFDVQHQGFDSEPASTHGRAHAPRFDNSFAPAPAPGAQSGRRLPLGAASFPINQSAYAPPPHQPSARQAFHAPGSAASFRGVGFHDLQPTSASHGSPHYYPTLSSSGMSAANSPDGGASNHALADASGGAVAHGLGHLAAPPSERRGSVTAQMGGAGAGAHAGMSHQPALGQMQYANTPAYQNSPSELAHAETMRALSPSQGTPADMTDFADDAQDWPSPSHRALAGSGQTSGQSSQSQGPNASANASANANANTHAASTAMPHQQYPKQQQQQQQQQQRPVEIQKTTDIKARACDECRRRKTACYYLKGNDAKCFRCQMEDVECTFSKRQGGSQAASASASTAAGSGGGAYGGRMLPISQRAAAKHASANSIAVQSAGPIDDYSQLPGRSLLKKSLSLQHPRSSFSVGQHGLWDQRVLESIVLDKSGQARISANLSLRKVGNDSWFMVRNEGGHSDWIRDCDEIERTVYPYGRALVNSFFMFFHPEYPVLHEKIFIEKYLRTYRELMPALLGAVYLQGMRWWYHSPELATVARPHHVMPALYDLVIANFFKSSGGASLSLIQAGLLLLQCSFAETRHLSICSVINTTAYRLALNRNCLHWKLPKWEINLRLRLSWAAYSQSTWISLFESIPPLTQDSSWFLSPLNADNFDSGTYEPSQGGALFIQMNKLSLIVHDIHNLLSSRLMLMYSSPTSVEQATSNNANTNRWIADPPGQFGSRRTLSIETDASLIESGVGSGGGSGNGSSSSGGGGAAGGGGSFGDTPSSTSQADSPKPGAGSGPGPSPGRAAELQPGMTVEEILELIKPIQIRLRQWYNGLPAALSSIDGEKPTGNYSLRLAYIAAEVSLHRFIIRAITSQSVPPAARNPELVQIVKSSARDRLEVAASLVAALRPQHLQQFWYFASAYQFAVIGLFAALMYTTSESQAEAEYYCNMLHEFVTQLQMYSDSDIISAALRTLRSSIAGVPGLAF